MKKNCALGIDIGGSTMRGGILVEDTGALIGIRSTLTLASEGGEAILLRAETMARELAFEAGVEGLEVQGIGIALAELVDLSGEPASAHTLPLAGMRVRERFAAIAPAIVEADSRAAALGEAVHGAGRPYRTFLYITAGTGIGCALVIDRIPQAGARGAAGTIASAPQTFRCTRCGATSRAVLEDIASGPALAAAWRERTGSVAAGAEEVVLAAVEGNPIALEIVKGAAEVLGSAVALLVNVLDPEAVIAGGGLGSAPGPYHETFVRSVREHIWSDLNRELPIVKAGHGALAGVVGAAARALAEAAR
jgi:glucokinase